jgi:hypothetical protein
VGYLIDPPQRVEGVYVAVFAQTGVADGLALSFLRDRGLNAKSFPQMGDLAFDAFGSLGSSSLFGDSALVCVPEHQADAALDALEFDSGLVDE